MVSENRLFLQRFCTSDAVLIVLGFDVDFVFVLFASFMCTSDILLSSGTAEWLPLGK